MSKFKTFNFKFIETIYQIIYIYIIIIIHKSEIRRCFFQY